MKKFLLACLLAQTALFGAEKVWDVNGKFANQAKGWSRMSSYGKLVYVPAQNAVQLTPTKAKVPYMDASYGKTFIFNPNTKIKITAEVKGEGRVSFGASISGIGNRTYGKSLTANWEKLEIIMDLTKDSAKLPAKGWFKFIMVGKGGMVRNIQVTQLN